MKILLTALVVALLSLSVIALGAQNDNARPPGGGAGGGASPARKRPPVFRATKEQIKQAQVMWN